MENLEYLNRMIGRHEQNAGRAGGYPRRVFDDCAEYAATRPELMPICEELRRRMKQFLLVRYGETFQETPDSILPRSVKADMGRQLGMLKWTDEMGDLPREQSIETKPEPGV